MVVVFMCYFCYKCHKKIYKYFIGNEQLFKRNKLVAIGKAKMTNNLGEIYSSFSITGSDSKLC